MMIVLLDFLIFCNLIIPAMFVARRCLSKGRLEIDHNLLFSIGFIFYCVSPVIFGLIEFERDSRLFGIWYEFFGKLSDSDLVLYMFGCLGFYASFVFGGTFGKRIVIRHSLEELRTDQRVLDVFWLMGTVLAGICIYMLSDIFFTGYTTGGTPAGKGTFTAVNVYLLSLALIYSVKRQERLGGSARFFRVIINRYFVTYFIVCILLLSLGGRMWFVSTVLILMVYRTVYFHPIRLVWFLLFIGGVVVLTPLFAHIRTGQEISLEDLLNVVYMKGMFRLLLTETMFLNAGMLDFVKSNEMPLVAFPKYLVSELVKIIPSFIFPGKGALIIRHTQDGYSYFGGYGAIHPFIPIIINFGIIGLAVVPFSLSALLGFLKKGKSYLARVMYVMITGWIAIVFFRDFNNTIVKLIFELSIMIPIMIAFMLHIVPTAVEAFKASEGGMRSGRRI